jgi:zinc transport system substrate-binding protein
MKAIVKSLSVLIVITLILVGCTPNEIELNEEKIEKVEEVSSTNDDKLVIYTSIYPLFEFAQSISQNHADVHLMVPAGSEPHDYEPTAKMVGAIEKADVFIYNGSGMEPWVESLLGSISNDDLIVINATENMELLTLEEGHDDHDDKDDHGDTDPHVWLDPIKAKELAATIYSALIAVDTTNTSAYNMNLQNLNEQFDTLNLAYENALKNPSNKNIVVGHAAFGYLTNRYELNQIAIAGLSPLEEPSAAQLGKISDMVKELNIQVIYYDALSSGKLTNVIALEAGVLVKALHPLGSVTQEDLDAGKNYFSIMYENLDAIKLAVQ